MKPRERGDGLPSSPGTRTGAAPWQGLAWRGMGHPSRLLAPQTAKRPYSTLGYGRFRLLTDAMSPRATVHSGSR